MSKRAINYVKPQDPSFLAKLKAEIGYKEGPNVDTKRAKLEDAHELNSEEEDVAIERSDEQPQIVVLKTGDLTADQVAAEKQRLEYEKATTKADLSQPITFKKNSTTERKEEKIKKDKQSKKGETKLSFSYSDEENE